MAGHRSRWFSGSRYEDDVLIMSLAICPRCIEVLVLLIYSSEVRFDVCDDNLLVSGACVYNKFLDMRIGLTFNSISFDLWHVNLRYALSGVLEHRTKCRFPPPLGLKQTVLQRLSLFPKS